MKVRKIKRSIRARQSYATGFPIVLFRDWKFSKKFIATGAK